MYLPWVLRAASISDIEKRRSRETAGRLRYQFVKRIASFVRRHRPMPGTLVMGG